MKWLCSTKLISLAALLWLTVLAGGCGQEVPEGSLVIPRGATISVRTQTPISTRTHMEGDTFTVILDAPLRRENDIFVPMGAEVDGVVEGASDQNDSEQYIAVRLTRLHLPNGDILEIETTPITRQAREMASVAGEINAATGMERKIDELAGLSGNTAASPSVESQLGNQVSIPANSDLVFTMDKDLVIPPSAK